MTSTKTKKRLDSLFVIPFLFIIAAVLSLTMLVLLEIMVPLNI